MDIGQFFSQYLDSEQKKKVKNYLGLNRVARPGGILFSGSSLMEQFPISELARNDFPTLTIYNRGVGGYTSAQFLEKISTLVLDLRPSVLFLNIGTNDLVEAEHWEENLYHNLNCIYCQIRDTLPDTKVYIMKFYPVNPFVDQTAQKYMLKVRTQENLERVNRKNEELARQYGFDYIDVNDGLIDDEGYLRRELTVEGVHMYTDGYMIVYSNIRKYLEKAASQEKD